MKKLVDCSNCSQRFDPKIHENRCPDCGTHYQPRKPGSIKQVEVGCAYNDHGVRCDRRGIIASNTNGTGPWYCRQHAWVILHDKRDKEPEPEAKSLTEVQTEARDYCKQHGLNTRQQMLVFIKQNTAKIGRDEIKTDWARKIIHRIEAGEHVAFRTEELAREALEMPWTREPGED